MCVRRVASAYKLLALVVMLPAIAAHELTHAAIGSLWGDVVSVSVYPPQAVVEYPAGTSKLAIRIANLAPTIVGLLVLPVLAMHVDTLPVIIGLYLVASWGLFTLPVSKEDRHPFAGM